MFDLLCKRCHSSKTARSYGRLGYHNPSQLILNVLLGAQLDWSV
jgi:hypothetical protein